MTVFVSYAHEDEEWREHVGSFLSLLKRQKLLDFEIWDDGAIDPGDRWENKIKEAMEKAKVAVLLVSKHFLNSDFINDKELPFFLERMNAGETKVLPVMVSPCPVQLIPWLDALQRFPSDDRTLLGLAEADREQHLSDLAVEVLRLHSVQSEVEEEPEEEEEAEAATVATGYEFMDEAGIRSVVQARTYQDTIAALQFFETRKQHTWLVTVPGRVYCVMDSERTSEADRLIQWSMSLSRGVPVRARQRSDRKHSGLLDIGKRQNWLYSTTLFDPPGDLENAVRQLINDALA